MATGYKLGKETHLGRSFLSCPVSSYIIFLIFVSGSEKSKIFTIWPVTVFSSSALDDRD